MKTSNKSTGSEIVEVEKKRCPLLGKNKDGIVEVCGEEKCAWWIVNSGLCAITQIAITTWENQPIKPHEISTPSEREG